MTARDFAFWLQGFIEISCQGGSTPDGLTRAQLGVISKHLDLVFRHEIDPSMGPPGHQAELNHTHGERPDGTILRC